MSRSALPIAIGPGPLRLASRHRELGVRLSADTAAIDKMIDFDKTCPAVIDPECSIETALTEMHGLGVRVMVVAHGERVLGLITADILEGERPIQFLQSTDCLQERCRHADIRVTDLMIPWDALHTVPLEAISLASIGQVIDAMQMAGAPCLVVVEETPDVGGLLIRGLFSLARLEGHLGRGLMAGPR